MQELKRQLAQRGFEKDCLKGDVDALKSKVRRGPTRFVFIRARVSLYVPTVIMCARFVPPNFEFTSSTLRNGEGAAALRTSTSLC